MAKYKQSSCIGRKDILDYDIPLPLNSPRWLPYHPPPEETLDFTNRRQARENFENQPYVDCDQKFIQQQIRIAFE